MAGRVERAGIGEIERVALALDLRDGLSADEVCHGGKSLAWHRLWLASVESHDGVPLEKMMVRDLGRRCYTH